MSRTGEKTLLLFQSVHQVLAAERVLKGILSEIEIVPVPKELRSSCGVALEVLQKQLKASMKMLKREGLRPEAIYTKVGNEYIERE